MSNTKCSFWLWAVVIFSAANTLLCLYGLAKVISSNAFSGTLYLIPFFAKPVLFCALAVLTYTKRSYAVLTAFILLLMKLVEFLQTSVATPFFNAMPDMMAAIVVGYWIGAIGVLAMIVAYLNSIRKSGVLA